MNRYIAFFAAFLLITSLHALPLKAGWDEGKVATSTEKVSYLETLVKEKKWGELVEASSKVEKGEALYFLGLGYFHKDKYDFAHKALESYIKTVSAPSHFEEATLLHYNIASKFYKGEKKHLFGVEKFPKWMNGKRDALAIFDRVIESLPHHKVALDSLLKKGDIHLSLKEYKEAMETYRAALEKFQGDPLLPKAHLGILKGLYLSANDLFSNPHILKLAKNELKLLKEKTTDGVLLSEGEKVLDSIKEGFAKEMFEIGRFYEKKKKLKAALVCYKRAKEEFPKTDHGEKAYERYETLRDKTAQKSFGPKR